MAATPLRLLSSMNAHERDERLAFDGPSHTYVVDGLVACRSVTQAVSTAFPAFDADAAIAAMRNGRKWTEDHPLYAKSDDDIKALWKTKGEAASHAGTGLHAAIEAALNHPAGTMPLDCPEHPEYASGFVPFMASLDPSLTPYRTEWQVFDKRRRLAGCIDAVFYDAQTGTHVLYDWKRTAKIPLTNRWRSGNGKLSHLPDCKGARYALQLNLYALILEQCYGITVSAMNIVHMHPDMEGPHRYAVLPVPKMEHEASLIAASPAL